MLLPPGARGTVVPRAVERHPVEAALEFFDGLGAPGGILFETGQHERIEFRRDGQLAALRWRHRYLLEMLHEHLHGGLRFEYQLSREQVVGDAPERVDVG